MKKNVILFSLLLMVTFTACASRVEAVPVSTYQEEVFVSTCQEEKPQERCSKEVKIVHYSNDCFGTCDFPVTVRKKSTCKYGGGM